MKKLLLILLFNSSTVFGADSKESEPKENVIRRSISRDTSYDSYLCRNKEERESIPGLNLSTISQDVWDENGNKLIKLILSGDLSQDTEKEIEDLIDSREVDINSVNENDETPLIIACKNNYTKFAMLLLKYNAETNVRNYQGESALSFAVIRSNIVLIKLLFKKGAKINDDAVLLSRVCLEGNKKIVKIFIDFGANFEITDSKGVPALYYASKETKSFIQRKGHCCHCCCIIQ